MSSALNDFQAASPAEPTRTARACLERAYGGLAGGARRTVHAYAQVLFCGHRTTGLLFLAATLVSPLRGLGGLLGLAATMGFAHLLGRAEAELNSGFHAFNGLLVGLALSATFSPGVPLLALIGLASLICALMGSALTSVSERYLAIPVLSMPFVLASWTALLAARRFAGLVPEAAPVSALGAGLLPEMTELYLRSLGACFFQTGLVSGTLVLAGLLWSSRWAVLLSAVGFVSGAAVHLGLGGAPADLTTGLLGFNFILTAIAVGGTFVLLGPGSILLAAAGAAASAVVCAGLTAGLEPLALPALAMPFVLVTQLVLYAGVVRARPGGPRLVGGAAGSPEENLARVAYAGRRYPNPSTPAVYLPVMGRWLVTQGHDGEHTHQGLWTHAWDFEVDDELGSTHAGDGSRVEDYYAFGAPVVAPAEGRVITAAGHHPDNPIGEVDTLNNWGNVVIIEHVGGIYTALCHLKQGSLSVAEGDRVARGQLLARVGSSGRSPVPHLHFQLQRSPELGAPTCYGELLHYVTGRGSCRYTTCGVPMAGDHVAPLEGGAERARSALSFAPGRRWQWTVRRGGRTRTERWESRIDALGARCLVADEGRARAAVYADDRYSTLLDYHGPRDQLLGLLYMGLPRAPYADGGGLSWRDTPSATPFVGRAARLAHELAMPFSLCGAVATTSRIARQGDALVVTTHVNTEGLLGGSELPDRIVVTCLPEWGPVQIRAYRGNELRTEAEVER